MKRETIIEKLRDTGERILSSGGPGFEVYGERAVVFGALLLNAAKELESPPKSYCSECEGTGTVTVATAQCCGRPGDECCGMPIPVPAPEPCPACHGGELLTPPTNRQFNFALGLLDSARQEITPIIGETASLCSAIDDFLRTGEVPSNCEEQASRSEPHKPGPSPTADEDGRCTRCGCRFEDPRELTHECPPGFQLPSEDSLKGA